MMKQAQQERQYAAACERAGKTRMGARVAMATFAPVRTVTGPGGGSAAGAPTVTVTRAVRGLLTDDARWEVLAAGARRRVAAMTWRRSVDQLLDIYAGSLGYRLDE